MPSEGLPLREIGDELRLHGGLRLFYPPLVREIDSK